MATTFEEKAKSLVATAAQIARARNAEPIATVLEESSASLIQSGSDPEGPTVYYTLMLEVPIKTYATIEENRESLEHEIRERLRPIVRPYADNWISEVIISPNIAEESRSTAPAPEQGEASEEVPSFWQPGFFRMFITHTSAHKVAAHNLASFLKKFQIVSFVAHDDIEPTKEWQAEIERALRTADALTAIITPDFLGSKWCDQEVGFAFGRGKLVVPLRTGADPYGFLGKYQGLPAKGLEVRDVAEKLADILIGHNLTAQRMADALVERLATSNTYENSKDAMRVLERLSHLNTSQVARLVESIDANDQVRDSFGVPGRIRNLVSKIGK
jgi:TIR domain